MPITIVDADLYIGLNVIDIDDWIEADEQRKQRILNTSERILKSKFPEYVIPDLAVYEYAASLATATNDTNKLQMQGVEQFSIPDVSSFRFNRSVSDLSELIPQSALDFIASENGITSLNPHIKIAKWTVF
ncbi:hypothetical protein [Paenisporosarcina sp. NPDC076898]|uniref:hypothetical protein n=1 Tax=unclassified Paenisporosarcina TaxID=2642018 RepID=UPI003D01D3ED